MELNARLALWKRDQRFDSAHSSAIDFSVCFSLYQVTTAFAVRGGGGGGGDGSDGLAMTVTAVAVTALAVRAVV